MRLSVLLTGILDSFLLIITSDITSVTLSRVIKVTKGAIWAEKIFLLAVKTVSLPSRWDSCSEQIPVFSIEIIV